MLILDRLGDFNEVMEYYEKILDIIVTMKFYSKQDKVEQKIKELLDDKYIIPAMRVLFMNCSLEIMHFEELIKKDMSDKANDDFIEKEWILDDVFELSSISKQEKMRQIRNCLAHAMYEIRINDEFDANKDDIFNQNNNVSFFINNGKIKAVIPYGIGLQLVDVYKRIYIRNHGENNLTISFDEGTLKSIDEKKAINAFAKSIKTGEKSIDEKNIKLVKSYIQWIGVKRFKNLDYRTKYRIISDAVGLLNNGLFLTNASTYNLGGKFIDTVRHYRYIGDKTIASVGLSRDFLLKNNLNVFRYQIPQLYISVLMGMCNYCFSYVREINENRGEKLFEYIDIDLSGINISSQSNRSPIKEINLNSKLKEKRDKKKQILKNRSKVDNIPDIEKRQIAMEKFKDKYEEGLKLEKELDIEIEELIQRISSSKEIVYDSFNFFRCLRNSISHGRYKIDYMKFFKTGKLEDMQVTFQDYNEQTNLIEVEATMSVKKLIDLIKSIQDRVNKSMVGKNIQISFLQQALVHLGIGEHELAGDIIIEKGRASTIDKV